MGSEEISFSAIIYEGSLPSSTKETWKILITAIFASDAMADKALLRVRPSLRTD